MTALLLAAAHVPALAPAFVARFQTDAVLVRAASPQEADEVAGALIHDPLAKWLPEAVVWRAVSTLPPGLAPPSAGAWGEARARFPPAKDLDRHGAAPGFGYLVAYPGPSPTASYIRYRITARYWAWYYEAAGPEAAAELARREWIDGGVYALGRMATAAELGALSRAPAGPDVAALARRVPTLPWQALDAMYVGKNDWASAAPYPVPAPFPSVEFR